MSVNMQDLIIGSPPNFPIQDAITKCYTYVKHHHKILVSVSGGADSDTMCHLIVMCGGKDKSRFVFFNTGLEYKATKDHLNYLENEYCIEIERIPPVKPIPVCVKEYGVPFWSKQVSEMMERLQRHGFQWEDEPLDVLLKKYPKCKAALRWWCNDFSLGEKVTMYDIAYVPWLKEFIIENPPKFRISNKCCMYAKKLPAKKFLESQECDLNCVGVRKNEGGARSLRYSSCFTETVAGADEYRPVFWFTDRDKELYKEHYGLTYSDCYEVWGMQRTGCAGCPFSRNYEAEIALAEKYEPNFHKAMIAIFGESYEYRRKFEEYRRKRGGSGGTV